MPKLLCSTGALVGRICNYDFSLIGNHIPKLIEDGLISGMEFMMIPYYYDHLDAVTKTVIQSHAPAPIIHCEKDVGVLLSDCTTDSTNKSLELFKINCETGQKIGSDKMVFHLWGGVKSDFNVNYNISTLDKFIDIAKAHNLTLLIENIPCTTYSGMQNWLKILTTFPSLDFTFDTRFGAFHDEIKTILTSNIVWNHIKHIHISDYSSYPRDFSKIRPILHPGEGVIDFDYIFSSLKTKNYDKTITLESPVMQPYGIDLEKLKKSLLYLKTNLL